MIDQEMDEAKILIEMGFDYLEDGNSPEYILKWLTKFKKENEELKEMITTVDDFREAARQAKLSSCLASNCDLEKMIKQLDLPDAFSAP